jgi:hypothetical protein
MSVYWQLRDVVQAFPDPIASFRLPELIFTMTSTGAQRHERCDPCLGTKTGDAQKFRYCNLLPEHQNLFIICGKQ